MSDKKMKRTDISNKIPIADQLDFATSEAYNVLRTNLSFTIPGKRMGKVVGVTSASPHDGKSYTCVNLCYALAKDGHKTLLISSDLRRPTVEKIMSMSVGVGLSNILAEGLEVNQEVLHTCVLHDNLSVITSGSIPPNPSELLGSEQMGELIDSLKDSYEYIVLDLPPVTSVIDPIAVSKYLDGMVFVVRHGFSKKKNIVSAMNQLKYSGVRVLGFVYNCYKTKSGYFKSYNKYYKNNYYTSKR